MSGYKDGGMLGAVEIMTEGSGEVEGIPTYTKPPLSHLCDVTGQTSPESSLAVAGKEEETR